MRKAKIKIQIYIDPDDYFLLRKLAEEKKIPVSILGRIIVSEYLSQLKKSSPSNPPVSGSV